MALERGQPNSTTVRIDSPVRIHSNASLIVRPPPRAAERRLLPHAPRHQLEGSHGNLCTGSSSAWGTICKRGILKSAGDFEDHLRTSRVMSPFRPGSCF